MWTRQFKSKEQKFYLQNLRWYNRYKEAHASSLFPEMSASHIREKNKPGRGQQGPPMPLARLPHPTHCFGPARVLCCHLTNVSEETGSEQTGPDNYSHSFPVIPQLSPTADSTGALPTWLLASTASCLVSDIRARVLCSSWKPGPFWITFR